MELATDENFDAHVYLAANPDIAAAGVPAREHFEAFGRAEERSQIADLPRNRDAKYRRFRHALAPPLDRVPSGTFPITTGDRHFDLAAYAGESANPGVPEFEREIADNPDKLPRGSWDCGRMRRRGERSNAPLLYLSSQAKAVPRQGPEHQTCPLVLITDREHRRQHVRERDKSIIIIASVDADEK